MLFTLIPMLCSIVLAFMEWNGGIISNAHWVGLNNFSAIFSVDKLVQKGFGYFFGKTDLGVTLINTISYTIFTVPLTILCSLCLALFLNKAVRFARLFRAVFFFPYVASLVAICVCWNMLLMKAGPVNQFLHMIGIPIQKGWTASGQTAIWAIIFVSIWRNMGYYMVIYLAGLQGIPHELYEAATVDGATRWEKFRYITLPQLSPTTFFVSVMLVINCFKVYDVVEIMTQGGPGRATKMLVSYIFELSFKQVKYGMASAVSMVLFLLVLSVTLFQFRLEKRFE